MPVRMSRYKPPRSTVRWMAEQLQQEGIVDLRRQLREQDRLVDALVEALHVGAQHMAILRQALLHFPYRRLQPAVSFNMHAAWRQP